LQGATEGRLTDLQLGLFGDARLQFSQGCVGLRGDQLLHRLVVMLQSACAPARVWQGGTAAADTPTAQEFFNERFADAEFVSEILLRVVTMVFMKPNDAFAQIIREG
jgi:hypothetical protein